MNSAAVSPALPTHRTPPQLPDYRDALALALSAFSHPAMIGSSSARAAAFVCALAGAVTGYGDKTLGDAIFSIVQPPATTPAGAV